MKTKRVDLNQLKNIKKNSKIKKLLYAMVFLMF